MVEKFRWKDVRAEPVAMEGAEGVSIRWLIDERRGARNFAMRVFEIAPGGHTPFHKHAYEHEVFIMQGQGKLRLESVERSLEPGDIVWAPPDEPHQFQNAGSEPFFFMCLVPIQKK